MESNYIITSVLAIDFEAIEWDKIEQSGYFVTYTLPQTAKWDYLQNWYLSQSRYPYYMNTGAATLYVKYPSPEAVETLVYDEQAWTPKEMNVRDKRQFHALVKLLMSDYFNRREILVSNSDFYLPVYTTDKGNLKILEITLSQRQISDNLSEFVIEDGATTMVKAREVQPGDMYWAQYFMDSKDGFAVVRRLNPRRITDRHIQQGVYIKLKNKKYRTRMRHLHVGSEYQFKRCRVYPLWNFIVGLKTYFNEMGLPFVQRQLPYQKVSSLSPQELLHSKIDMHGMTVYVVDDRLRPTIQPTLEPSGFLSELTQRIQELSADQDWTPTLIPVTKAELKAGDLVLRLQDNSFKDFKPDVQEDEQGQKTELNPALLRAYGDPYKIYQKEYGDTISQSLSVNLKTASDEDEDLSDDEDDEDVEDEVNESQTEQDYMSYKLPTKRWLKVRLLNSLYQLYLKNIVSHPENAAARFPVLELMQDNIFLYADSLVYLQDGTLRFMQATNNLAALSLVQDRTGWNLLTDVLQPAMDYQYRYNKRYSEKEKMELVLKNSRFMISPDYVWQIDNSKERVLPDVPEIQQRLWAIESARSKEDFMPTYSEAELAVFEADKLRAFEEFLRRDVPDYHISFKKLTSKVYRDRFYPLLGITTSTRFKTYLAAKGLEFKSPKGGDVLPAYIGISYIPETQQYYVGDKHSMNQNYRQDKGFVLRRVEVHRSKPDLPPMLEQLKTNLFPLLEVDFIRYKRYTVYPFPFNLIEVWKKMVLKDGEADEPENE